jgi:hypothetical protein
LLDHYACFINTWQKEDLACSSILLTFRCGGNYPPERS